jgi:trehalose 6-phosphate synthase
VDTLKNQASSEIVATYRQEIEGLLGDRQLILRIDRIEPSKNIIRGFQAFQEMLNLYPEHQEKVLFLAILVPSRTEVKEYQDYLSDVMAQVGRINAALATADWEPVRLVVGEKYERALAAMQRYDVLLVNSIADGMNLVAKEGPIVNKGDGQLVLSERTGAREQLESAALVISPCDINATANALHEALIMPIEKRRQLANELREVAEAQDINWWLCEQIKAIVQLQL